MTRKGPKLEIRLPRQSQKHLTVTDHQTLATEDYDRRTTNRTVRSVSIPITIETPPDHCYSLLNRRTFFGFIINV